MFKRLLKYLLRGPKFCLRWDKYLFWWFCTNCFNEIYCGIQCIWLVIIPFLKYIFPVCFSSLLPKETHVSMVWKPEFTTERPVTYGDIAEVFLLDASLPCVGNNILGHARFQGNDFFSTDHKSNLIIWVAFFFLLARRFWQSYWCSYNWKVLPLELEGLWLWK